MCVCVHVHNHCISHNSMSIMCIKNSISDHHFGRTKKAMGGSVTFREALQTRLSMIKPTKQQLQDFAESKDIEDILTPRVA